ncbi:MAG TPA: hypothetical protein VJH03_03000 [Blastocatellia bacterium]|nr:hypothetical protein [Blastocatellia bacterium]
MTYLREEGLYPAGGRGPPIALALPGRIDEDLGSRRSAERHRADARVIGYRFAHPIVFPSSVLARIGARVEEASSRPVAAGEDAGRPYCI